jgi:hypothetical protein
MLRLSAMRQMFMALKVYGLWLKGNVCLGELLCGLMKLESLWRGTRSLEEWENGVEEEMTSYFRPLEDRVGLGIVRKDN